MIGNTFHHSFPCPLALDEDDKVVDVAGKVQPVLSALHVLPLRDTLQEPDPSCRAFEYSRRIGANGSRVDEVVANCDYLW